MAVATAIPLRHHLLNPLNKELRQHWYHCTTTSVTSLSNPNIHSFNVCSIKGVDITVRVQQYCGILLGPLYCYQDSINILKQASSCCTNTHFCVACTAQDSPNSLDL
jgi:hypothetical protein